MLNSSLPSLYNKMSTPTGETESLGSLSESEATSSQEIDSICDKLRESFVVNKNAESALYALSRLCTILQSSHTKYSLPGDIITSMVNAIITQDKTQIKQRLLSEDILRKLSNNDATIPVDHVNYDLLPTQQPIGIQTLRLLLIQGDISHIKDQLQSCISWILDENVNLSGKQQVFWFLLSLSSLHPGLLTSDELAQVNSKICEWLMNASLYQTPSPHSKTVFRKEQKPLTDEVDGSPTQNFFTVLNIGKYYSDDQVLNIFTFSNLYRWLNQISTCTDQPCDSTLQANDVNPPTDMEHSTIVRAAMEYCFRVMDQCERKPKNFSDQELQMAVCISDYSVYIMDLIISIVLKSDSCVSPSPVKCQMECVRILDRVCQMDASRVPQVFGEVKRLYGKLAADGRHPRLILGIIQLFLNHSSSISYDAQPAYSFYFDKLLTKYHSNQAVAFDTVTFIINNIASLTNTTDILTRYSPNIMKIFAWHPRSFLSEFLEILPSFITSSSTIEVLHSILDLPCVSACLDLSQRVSSERINSSTQQSSYTRPINEFLKPANGQAFAFILRTEAGYGDTIDRLDRIHEQLEDIAYQPRVLTCAQTVPCLLLRYFNHVLSVGDYSVVRCLVPVILERSSLLFNITEYQCDVRKLFADNLCIFFSTYPALVADESADILDYFNGTRVVPDKEYLFTALVWAVGEFCSSQRSGPQLVCSFYEILETLMYEISWSQEPFSGRVIRALMSCLAKLATRSQDLIARVILCLTKVINQQRISGLPEDVTQSIVSRAHELVNILRHPNFSSIILNPDCDSNSGRNHVDPTSERVVLRAVNKHLTTQTT